MMKAVRIMEHGSADTLVYGDFDMPEIGEHDVCVRVLASTVSRWDLKYREGELKGVTTLPGRKKFPLPMQPGRDAAGVVEAVGSKVRAFRPGDRVVGLVHPSNAMSPMTIRGLSNLSTEIEYPGHTMFGGNAQFVSRPESYWLPLPDGVSPQVAAAAMWSYATSHRILTSRLDVRVGDTVLIVGGSGGMGSAALDLARAMGLRTVAVTRSERKADFLRSLGASDVFIVPGDGVVDAIRNVGSGLGLDGAVDFSGDEAMLRLGFDVLRPAGTIVVVAHVGDSPRLPFTAYDCVRLEINLRGARASTVHDQQSVLRLLAQGVINPRIHAVLPLSEIRTAHKLLESGDVSGRIVLDPWA
jgi:NADPH:quinone reductase-like Zn-dependent oxidoreductase